MKMPLPVDPTHSCHLDPILQTDTRLQTHRPHMVNGLHSILIPSSRLRVMWKIKANLIFEDMFMSIAPQLDVQSKTTALAQQKAYKFESASSQMRGGRRDWSMKRSGVGSEWSFSL